MALEAVNPPELARPVGYSHGLRGRGELLFVAGQVGWDAREQVVSDDFVAQFAQALDNVLAVVRAAGGRPDGVARLTVYVTDKDEYLRRRRELGQAWQQRFGRHYPAMALVEVRALLEPRALLEIEATALL